MFFSHIHGIQKISRFKFLLQIFFYLLLILFLIVIRIKTTTKKIDENSKGLRLNKFLIQ